METQGRNLDLEVRQRAKELLVGQHNGKLCAVPPSRRGLLYVAMPALRHDLESFR